MPTAPAPSTTVLPSSTAAVGSPRTASSAPTATTPAKPTTVRPTATTTRAVAPAPAKPKVAPVPVVAQRGSRGTAVLTIQRNLAALGLFPRSSIIGTFGPITQASVMRYQRSLHLAQTGVVTRALYDRLARDAAARPTVNPPASTVLDRRCLTGARVLCISKTTRTLYYVTYGRIVTSMSARFGAWDTPTREGTFSVYWKSRNHVSTIYGSAMPFAMFFSGGQAVHYSSDFAARGYAGASHGCINIRNYAGLQWVFDQVHVGDKVVVYR